MIVVFSTETTLENTKPCDCFEDNLVTILFPITGYQSYIHSFFCSLDRFSREVTTVRWMLEELIEL